MLGVLLSGYLVIYIFNHETQVLLTSEDGFFENIGAASFLLTSVIFTITFLAARSGNDFGIFKTKRNVFFLLLGLLFFFAFAEEISWGQRILGLDPPRFIKEHNLQGEINIHNLRPFHRYNEEGSKKNFVSLLLNMDRLFSLFWLSFTVLVPLAARYSDRSRRLIKKINVPVAPLGIGLLFLFNYLFSKILERDVHPARIVVEIKEANFALLFLVLSLYFLLRTKDASFRFSTRQEDSGSMLSSR